MNLSMQRPSSNEDRGGGKAYWAAQGMAWRTEPEIGADRQQFLSVQRGVQADIEQGFYPFKDITLDRADVEWLLATHESGGMHGPVDWSDEKQREREGLDLRGADLNRANLSELPLARVRAGSNRIFVSITEQQRAMAQVQLNGADLGRAHVEGADLSEAQLRGAFLGGAWLNCTDFMAARLEGADLGGAHLNEASLAAAHLEGVDFTGADLRKAGLTGAYLAGTYFHAAHLEGAYLEGAQLQGKVLEGEELASIRKWKADFPATLRPANLWQAVFDPETVLESAVVGDEQLGGIFVGDVRWGDVNLTVIDWTPVKEVGEERTARALKSHDEPNPDAFKRGRLVVYERAVRANRQLAAVLRAQGLNEVADRFGFRAQGLQREVLRQQRAVGAWLFSLFLWVVSGYGYRLRNILTTYVGVLFLFTAIYALLGVHSFRGESGLQSVWDSFLVSLSAIHGRTTFEQLGAWSATAWVAAVESVWGIVIEGVFIAMLIQRFFGR